MTEFVGTALITGAAQRMGRAIALDLAGHNWRVVIHYRNSATAAQALADEINQATSARAAFLVRGDLGKEADTAVLVEQAVAAAGPLTCLINNASTFETDDFFTATRDSWDQHMEANLRAPVVLAQHFVEQLGQGSGNIINIIDQRVWRLTPKFMSYTVSKSALWTLTQTLAQALAPRVRVNAIGPGPTLANHRQDANDFANQARFVPLQRATGLEEICAGIRFIIDTPSLTGQMLALDGGQHLAWETPDVTEAGE